MKNKIKQIGAWILWLLIWITALTGYAYKDWIDLYFTQKNLISEMDNYTKENDKLRKDKVWLEFKLNIINTSIQWNKDKWNIANWKLELIQSFLDEAKQ